MKVWGYHDDGACGYYRLRLPLTELGKHGHDVRLHYGWNPECNDYPIIAGQRIGSVTAMPLWRRMRAGHKLVYELDDDVWTIDPLNVRAFLGYEDSIVDHVEQCIMAAHMVTVTTEYLAGVLRKFNDNVQVLPNFVDPAILSIEREPNERVTVGWAGGDSHLRDLAYITLMMREFLRDHPDVDFHNVGTDFLGVLKLRGRNTPWRNDPLDYYRALDFDIGLAPLAPTDFNRSKSHIKALEYAGRGIPVIATDMEPYRDFVIDGVTGFLIRDKRDWAPRLRDLVNDREMREEMGRKAKDVATQWTIDKGYRLWEQAYASL